MTTGAALQPLLAACFSASVFGGRVVREVVQTHTALDMVNKTEGIYDPQTVADRRSQQRIITALREAFPLLQIVGEEGELEAPAPEDVVHCDLSALDTVPFDGGDDVQNRLLEWDDLVLWVDPLDGTKRFAAKKFDEVSVLIGITYKQRPIAGVVHLPFHGKHGVTFWGGPGIGVFRSEHENESQTTHVKWEKPSPMFPKRPLICTVSSTNCDLVNSAVRQLAPATILTGGATGTMVLGVITGDSDAFFRFKAATRKWDICAVEPLIEALGGKITDTEGHVYVYDRIANGPDYDNERGLLACVEPEALQTVLNVMSKVNLTRALDGQEMTSQWFQACVFPGEQVSQVQVIADSIHHGKHSAVAKLEVRLTRSDGVEHISTVFLKKSSKNELPNRSEAHWKRDLASYRAEATFYAHFAEHLHSRGVGVIRPLAVFQSGADGRCTPNLVTCTDGDAAGCSTPENFLLLLECLGSTSPLPSSTTAFESYEAADSLGLADARQALSYLATLHASAWGQEDLLSSAKEELWPAACWWAFPKRGEEELAQAKEIWPQVLKHFEKNFTDASSGLPPQSELESLGQRMIDEAAYISKCLSVDEGSGNTPLQTLVHGDFKSANLFFESASRTVVAFDWQWSGVGLGAMDVANLLNTSVSISPLANDENELELLRFYYERLNQQFQTLRVTSDMQTVYPFEAFERHYMLATLEYGRLLISNFWKRMTPESCVAKATNANCGLGYRSIPHIVRMVRKLHEGLTRVELEHK